MIELVEIERVIDAPPERVFDAWLDAGAIARFMRPGEGVRTEVVELAAEVGGDFRFVMHAGETEIPISGTYLVVDRARALSFKWRSSAAGENSVVELSFAPEGAGTQMRLVHRGLPNDQARADHRGGWTSIAASLSSIL